MIIFFHQPQLLDYLRSHHKKYLLVAGLVTSVCVLLTAASASQLGFWAAIIGDCCVDYPEAHSIALQRYQGFMLDVTTLAELPQCWSRWQAEIRQLG